MPYVDRPLPAGLELAPIRDKRLDNLIHEGRNPGSVNKVTKDLKEGALIAAQNLGKNGLGEGGLIGYLEFLGWKHPRAFAQILAKVLPLQTYGPGPVRPAVAINITSIESGSYLSAEDIAKLQAQSQPVLELEPEPGDA